MARILIQVTDLKTGKPFFLSPFHIVAAVSDDGGRTQVLTTPSVLYLVKESPEEVAKLASAIVDDDPPEAPPSS